MLSAKGIYKKFGGVIALSNACLDLESGEVRALVGGNGSGKSTLSKILAGSYKQDQGKIYIDEKPLRINSPKDSQRLGIFLTYQELSLFPNLTVAQNLLISELPNIAGAFTDLKMLSNECKTVLEMLKLDHHLNTVVADVPLDDKYMVELAKAVIQKPKYLIIDEVASALRKEQVQQINDLMQLLSKRGCGILYVTHRLHEVFEMCKTITVMRSGSVVLTTELDKITPEEVVIYLSPIKKSGGKSISASQISTKAKHEKLPKIEKSTQEMLMEVEDITLPGYKNTVSINLRKGEIVGIAGLQGQGQSSLLRMIYGAVPGHRTSLRMNNKKIQIDSPETAIQNGIGFLSGDREKEGVFPIRSVKENIESIPDKFSKRLSKSEKMSSSDVVSTLGIVLGTIRQPLRSLSGGNQQKAIIGRWMTMKPHLLLCDDPTKGVDFHARMEVHSIFRNMANQGAGVIISSSDDAELIYVADRILVMYGGTIVKELIGEEMTEDNIITFSIPLKKGSQE